MRSCSGKGGRGKDCCSHGNGRATITYEAHRPPSFTVTPAACLSPARRRRLLPRISSLKWALALFFP